MPNRDQLLEEIKTISGDLKALVTFVENGIYDKGNLNFSMVIEPAREIGKNAALYLESNGIFPLQAYAEQLTKNGGDFLKSWIDVLEIAHGPFPAGEIANAVEAFKNAPRGDSKSFIKAAYWMQELDWVHMPDGKFDPIFSIILHTARICKRTAQIEALRAK